MSAANWSLRLARQTDAQFMPEIERAAGTLFQTVEGLAGLAGGCSLSSYSIDPGAIAGAWVRG